uniref:F-box domain-containing protein n=1 Tax=Kalanchoe fedtschenkoi TaxID=63787 RepID=A0A7N0VDA7_KALFE
MRIWCCMWFSDEGEGEDEELRMSGGGKGASDSESRNLSRSKEDEWLELELAVGRGENVRPFEPIRGSECLNLTEVGSSSGSADGGCLGSLSRWQSLFGGCSAADSESDDDEHDLQVKRPRVSTDIQIGPCGSPITSNASLIPFRSETVFQAYTINDGNGITSTKVEEYEHRMDLTDDLLHMVFSFLEHIHLCQSAMVCKQWRAASTHEDFWRCLSFENRRISIEQFEDMCRRYPNATEMNIMGTPSVHVLAMNAVSSLRNLEVLTVGKGPLGDPFFQALTDCSMLRNLTIHDAMLGNGIQEISISNDRLRHIQITKCRVMRIAVRCPQLETLSLKRSNMAHAALNCPLLHHLDLASCHKLSDAAIRFAATSCPILESLDISNCSSVSDETLREITQACASLRTLDASYCPNISLESVRLNMLTVLKLDCCESINSASMAAIANSHMLEVLEIKNCSLITTMALELPRLTTLKLVYCRKFVDLNLRCANLSSITVSNCAALRRISIMSNSLPKLVLQKQESLSTLVLQCPSLQEVDLTDCESLTNAVCQVFSDGGGCPMLKSLILDNCESLKSVGLSSTSLMSLSLVGCRGITSLGLQCPHLESVCLDGCDHLECASFSSVGLGSLNLGICPKLVKLHVDAPQMVSLELKGCGVLSEASINCPLLVSLDASFCCQLTDECLSTTASACPLIVSLILMSCQSLGSEGLLSLCWLTNLTSLDLSYTFLVDLQPVYEACRQLKVLKLQACKYLADTSLEPLYKESALPALRELDLSYGTLCQKAIEELLAYCTHLTHLSLNGCVNMHDLDWGGSPDQLSQFRGCSGSSALSLCETPEPALRLLQNLNCVGCQNIRKVHIPPAAHCSFLSSLNLSLSANLKEVDLSCYNLCILNLSNCASLEILKLECPKLTSLFLQSCNIDGEALEDSISQCHLLETLDVRFCPKIPPNNMGSLRAACPSLKRIFTSMVPA